MKFNRLGTSDLEVSEVCLGSMTWGVQNTEKDAHEQIEYALSQGVNFIDTAEMYPVPTSHKDQVPGTSERYIGTWLAKNPDKRSQLVIATKVIGYESECETVAYRFDPPKKPPYLDARLDAENIHAACDGSLRRLQTDYIDLYQLHWPDRYVPLFGKRGYNNSKERDSVPIRDTLLALKQLLDQGKIRAYGLSNETTYGVCEFIRLAKELDMPPPATIQNPFCLLNRSFEGELAEACAPSNFNIGLLPWSILAGGVLAGKYNGKRGKDGGDLDASLKAARHVLYPLFQPLFHADRVLHVVDKYMQVAEEHGVSVATLAQAFCKTRWYIPSSIIGATTIGQLKENIKAFDVELTEKALRQIDEIHNQNTDPITCVD